MKTFKLMGWTGKGKKGNRWREMDLDEREREVMECRRVWRTKGDKTKTEAPVEDGSYINVIIYYIL